MLCDGYPSVLLCYVLALELSQGIDQSKHWDLNAEGEAQHWLRSGAIPWLQANEGVFVETYMHGHFYCRHRHPLANLEACTGPRFNARRA